MQHRLTGWILAGLMLWAAPLTAHENEPTYDRVRFQVQEQRPVENDRLRVVLGVLEEGKDPAALAERVNRRMRDALARAKAVAGVEVRTGQYYTQPVYRKESLNKWRASQELILEGGDFDTLGRLVAELQASLQVRSTQFFVSDATRDRVEDELIETALQRFTERAGRVQKTLGARGYRLVDVNINTGGVVYPVARAKVMAAEAVAEPALEAGTSTLTVTVNGTIELIRKWAAPRVDEDALLA